MKTVTKASTDDALNPSYYKVNGIETITIVENMPFLQGNVIKYVIRYKNKDGVQDLKKARWYLDRLIKNEEKDSCRATQ